MINIKISESQYKYALNRIEELLPVVDESAVADNKNAMELSIMSEIVIGYEKVHFPI